MNRMRRILKKVVIAIGVLLVVLAIGGYIFYRTQMIHHNPSGTPAAVVDSGDRVLDGIRRGIEFLKVNQEADGEFSAGLLDPKPAFTCMVVEALVRSPEKYTASDPAIAMAVKAIVAHQQEDGGIYTPVLGLGNYCTSVAVMALSHVGDPSLASTIDKAKKFILACQSDNGGMGYGGAGRSDLSNTAVSLEALRAAGLSEDSDAYKRAAEFIAKCQNSSETNTEAWAGNDGGFIYRPGTTRARTFTDSSGQVRYESYGLMSYAGLVSFLWAGVDREEPRVQSAFRWVKDHWSLTENTNLGDAGLYYYFLTMAKALQAYGERQITTSDGVVHDWPVELADRILARQQKDGSWVNDNGRWLESDSVLVTSYMVRALSICHDVIHSGPTKGTND